MDKRSVDLCCSESSEELSALCTPWHCLTPSSNTQQSVRPESTLGNESSRQCLSDNQGIREELQMLLLREQQGPRLWNYLLTHDFMTIDHRELLVASISSAAHSQGYDLSTTALAVNILDRFATGQYLQRQDSGVMLLAALACLSLAAKLEEVEMPSTISALQAQEPWLAQYGDHDVGKMELLIMRALDWRPTALTSASFLDQLLYDALSGALYQLQYQTVDYLACARHLAAKMLLHAMPAVMHLTFPSSTQACAAVVVAFQALEVCDDALVYLIEEWTQLGIHGIMACVQTTISHVNSTHVKHAPASSLSLQSSQSPYHASTSDFPGDSCFHDTSCAQSVMQPAPGSHPVHHLSHDCLAPFLAPLETASSLTSADTMM